MYCDGYGVRLAARLIGLPVPHRMTGADWIWGIAAHVPGVRALALPAGVGPRRLDRGGGEAAPLVPAAGGARHPPRLLRPRRPPLRARAGAHRRAPAGRSARGHGHAPAGDVGRGERRPHRGLRRVDRRRAVRLRGRRGAARAPLDRRQRPRVDLPPGGGAAADVAALPAGQPNLPLPRAAASGVAGARADAGAGRWRPRHRRARDRRQLRREGRGRGARRAARRRGPARARIRGRVRARAAAAAGGNAAPPVDPGAAHRLRGRGPRPHGARLRPGPARRVGRARPGRRAGRGRSAPGARREPRPNAAGRSPGLHSSR